MSILKLSLSHLRSLSVTKWCIGKKKNVQYIFGVHFELLIISLKITTKTSLELHKLIFVVEGLDSSPKGREGSLRLGKKY